MHDLQAIAFPQRSFSPAVANRNFAIQLHRDAIALELQILDELRERSSVGALPRLAIDDDGHSSSLADKKGLLNGGLWY